MDNSPLLPQTKSTAKPDELDGLIPIESSPSSVPRAVFIRLPNETCFDRTLYSKTDLSAVSNINNMHQLDDFRKQIDTFTSKYYSYRSIYNPLAKHMIVDPEFADKMSDIAYQYAKPLVDLLTYTISTLDECTKQLTTIFNKTQWSTGEYSEELLYQCCRLIHRLLVLDKVRLKQSIKTDYNGFNKLSGQLLNNDRLINFMNDRDGIEKRLLHDLITVPSDSLNMIVSIFYRYLKNALQTNAIVLNDSKYTLLVSLAFFIKLCPPGIPISDIEFIKDLYETCPFIPLYHEVSMNAIDYLKVTNYFRGKQITFNPRPANPTANIKDLRIRFSDVSNKLHSDLSQAQNDDGADPNFVNTVIEAVKLISSTTGMLREQYASKLDKPPNEPPDMAPYERAVRQGYSQNELKVALQLIALCRELIDLIRSNKPDIYLRLCSAFQSTFQEFVKNILEKTAVRAKRKKKSLKTHIDQIRSIAGDYASNENSVITAKKSSELKGKRHEIASKRSPPSPQLLELIRIQIQHLINPESKFMQQSKKAFKAKHAYHENDEKRLQTFVTDTLNWTRLIAFEQTLSIAADQSSFYFKEFQLDLNNSVQFPVKSSLPYILCQYALENYVQPELTEIIFYPLSIYDDAANVATNTHHSQLMFDEIRAEAKVALDTLSNLIGEFTFNAFRTFATLRQLPDKLVENLKVIHQRHWPHSQAYRLRTLLQQNQYYLLSKQVALKTLISPRVDTELNNAVASIYALAHQLGIVASLTIDKSISIIRDTHTLLVDQGLSLMPFPDIERTAKWDNHLQSFNSRYLTDIINHLFKVIVRTYSLAINPLRMTPPKKLILPPEPLGKLYLGRILKDAFEPFVAFITVHHFSFALRSISDGAVVILAQQLRENMNKIFGSFHDKYKHVSSQLTRIKDAPFGTSTHTAFTRYEGAYKFFLNDDGIQRLLKDLHTIGNIIIVAELLDEALSMKEFNFVQIMSYLRSVDDNNHPRDDIETLFDSPMKEAIHTIIQRPLSIAEDSRHMFMTIAINELAGNIMRDHATYDEKNPKSLDFTQMTGFASCYSVVDFVYTFSESMRVGDAITGFAKHGQGVMIAAAIILLITGQTDLHKLLCIGKKMLRYFDSDMSGMADEKTLRYLAAAEYGVATVDWALSFFEPFVDNFKNSL